MQWINTKVALLPIEGNYFVKVINEQGEIRKTVKDFISGK